MIGSCRPRFNPHYRRNFSVEIFQDLSTLTGFNWIVSMVKSDLMDTFKITDSSCESKSKWPLVHLCTCKAAAERSNVYASGKKYKKYSLFLRQTYINQRGVKGRNEQEKKRHIKAFKIKKNICFSLSSSMTNACTNASIARRRREISVHLKESFHMASQYNRVFGTHTTPLGFLGKILITHPPWYLNQEAHSIC
jgi:hypothetical protein